MDRCVVRQAIKEKQSGKVIGYELVFQGGKDSMYNSSEATAADTISDFLVANSAKIINDGLMFVTVTPSLLLRNTPKMFGQDKVIIQIEDTVIIHPLAMPLIKKYCEAGYKFAINDFQFSPKYFSMLDYASYIRINMTGYENNPQKQRTVLNIIEMAKGFGRQCIATEINTKEQYEAAMELDIDYLEGNYMANTMVSKVDKVEYMQGNFFQLVIAVSKDEPNFGEVEEIISRDAGLTYALLRLVNSAYFALRTRTASLRQALITLGIGQLRHWVYMLSFDQNKTEGTEEILKRAPECKISSNDAYMMGMFSTLDYMVEAPLAELLEEIPVADEIKAALLEGTGPAGAVQNLVVAYEKADWKASKTYADQLGISSAGLAQIYVDCAEEVNAIWHSLMTDMERPQEEVKKLEEEVL